MSTWDGKVICGKDLQEKIVQPLLTEIEKRGLAEVIAEALVGMQARITAFENALKEVNLGEKKADSIDVQKLKVGGEDISKVRPNAMNASAGGPSQPVYFPASGANAGKPVEIPISTDQEVAAAGDFLTMQVVGAYYAQNSGIAARLSNNAAIGGEGQPVYFTADGVPAVIPTRPVTIGGQQADVLTLAVDTAYAAEQANRLNGMSASGNPRKFVNEKGEFVLDGGDVSFSHWVSNENGGWAKLATKTLAYMAEYDNNTSYFTGGFHKADNVVKMFDVAVNVHAGATGSALTGKVIVTSCSNLHTDLTFCAEISGVSNDGEVTINLWAFVQTSYSGLWLKFVNTTVGSGSISGQAWSFTNYSGQGVAKPTEGTSKIVVDAERKNAAIVTAGVAVGSKGFPVYVDEAGNVQGMDIVVHDQEQYNDMPVTKSYYSKTSDLATKAVNDAGGLKISNYARIINARTIENHTYTLSGLDDYVTAFTFNFAGYEDLGNGRPTMILVSMQYECAGGTDLSVKISYAGNGLAETSLPDGRNLVTFPVVFNSVHSGQMFAFQFKGVNGASVQVINGSMTLM